MIYVFDTNAFSDLFKSFYLARFPSLWQLFDEMVVEGRILSTREVYAEIQNRPIERLHEWAAAHREIFTMPTAAEGEMVAQIFAVRHFQHLIENKKLLKGGLNADPFIIAKAKVIGGTVITMEKYKPNGVKVPNICEHFEIPCLSLEEFMEAEEWEF